MTNTVEVKFGCAPEYRVRRFSFIPKTDGVRSKLFCHSGKIRGAGGVFLSPGRRQGCGGNFFQLSPITWGVRGVQGGSGRCLRNNKLILCSLRTIYCLYCLYGCFLWRCIWWFMGSYTSVYVAPMPCLLTSTRYHGYVLSRWLSLHT